jgi:predicted nucleic acid-binding protein
MPDNLFVDSNIWLYALMKDNSDKARKANEIRGYTR